MSSKLIQYDQSNILNEWKENMYALMKAKAKSKGIKLDKKKVYQYLNLKIQSTIKNPKVTVVNNYKNQTVRSDLLTVLDLIETNHLIIGAGGCLFHQHETKINLLLNFIKWVMDQRSFWKKERKNYEDGSYEYAYADLMQLMMKLIYFYTE